MTIYLADISFVNDFFSISLPDGSTLNLNKIDESIKIEGADEVSIKVINVEVIDIEGKHRLLPNVIGIPNDILSIETDYKEYEGNVLSHENMVYCTIEVYE